MTIHAKLIGFMATMLMLVLVVSVSIGTWVINSIIYKLNTELLSLKLEAKIDTIEAAVKLLEDSGATSIPQYIRQAQAEMVQYVQDPVTAEGEQSYVITGTKRQSLLPAQTGRDVNISAEVLTRMVETQSGTTDFRDEGVTYFTVYRYFAPWDWVIGISHPKATMFQQRQVYLTTVISFSILVFVGVFLLAYGIGKRVIVNPIAMLVSMTNAITAGHFDQTFQLPQRDELGLLADAIHTMAQQLRQNFAQIDEQLATIQRDIAERTQAEEKIRKLNAELEHRVVERTAKLEAANKELQSFAYVISHDLKAPLRGISRLVQWLEEDYAPHFDEKGKEMADLLVGRAKRMDALIDGILEYSRIGRVMGEHMTIDLNRLLSDVLDWLEPPPTVRIEMTPNFPTVVGDKIRIQQVFANLIGNAIKFMDKPQGIINIDYEDAGLNWRFCVRDNGPGIDPKYHEKIFQIFQVLVPRDAFESTGIGLSIVKKIVESYGGTIGVESTPEQGSTFWFTVPKHARETEVLE